MSSFGTIYELFDAIIPGVLFLKFNSYSQSPKELLEKQSDEKLISIFKENGNKQVIAVLFDRYIHLVFVACMKYFKESEDAQDAAMEIFEALEDKLKKYPIEYFKGWLYTTTRNHCLMSLRKSHPVERIGKIENFAQLSMENEHNLHLEINEEENDAMLFKYLSELKAEQKLCVELMYLKGKSYKDIAAETGYSEKNVKSFIQNGKRNLRLMLEQYYEEQRGT
jgi:RNA polymerase sigma factor (sigma-70 family)